MQIAIFADSHDNWKVIAAAVAKAHALGCASLIHCGDVCAPVTLGKLAELWGKEMHYCFGNVDGDPFLMLQKHGANPLIHHHGSVLGEVTIDDRKIAFQHYPKLARALACTGDYDAVFYGHDHTAHQEMLGKTLFANPGNLCDFPNPPSFGAYNTRESTFEIIVI